VLGQTPEDLEISGLLSASASWQVGKGNDMSERLSLRGHTPVVLAVVADSRYETIKSRNGPHLRPGGRHVRRRKTAGSNSAGLRLMVKGTKICFWEIASLATPGRVYGLLVKRRGGRRRMTLQRGRKTRKDRVTDGRGVCQ